MLGIITKEGENRTGNITTPSLFSPDVLPAYILNITHSSGLLKRCKVELKKAQTNVARVAKSTRSSSIHQDFHPGKKANWVKCQPIYYKKKSSMKSISRG